MSDSSDDSIVSSSGNLHYSRLGSGPKVLLAFHGFGQNKNDLKPFVEPFLDDHTVYCFDVFFHGHSNWNLNQAAKVTPRLWSKFIEAFIAKEKIDTFSLAGFSLGSRFALQIFRNRPQKVEAIYLLAPDNIKPDFWYELATGTALGKAVLKHLVERPGLFFRMVDFLAFIKFIDLSVKKFVAGQMNTRLKRKQVYHCWTAFRPLLIPARELVALLNHYKLPVYLFSGKMDRVVGKKSLRPLISKVKKCTWIELETGHHGLLKNAGKYLTELKTHA